ncbi:hypothetical protein AM202_03825, partial [Actinobacillus minor 202]
SFAHILIQGANRIRPDTPTVVLGKYNLPLQSIVDKNNIILYLIIISFTNLLSNRQAVIFLRRFAIFIQRKQNEIYLF